MTEEYRALEKEIVSYYIGFAANYGGGTRLSRGFSDIIDKINIFECPKITRKIFCEIENRFFENKIFDDYIQQWNVMGGCLPRTNLEQKERKRRLRNYSKSSPQIKINQKMIFAFFCGATNGIPKQYSMNQYHEIYEKFLIKISKELCSDEDLERLLDLEHYLTYGMNTFEIRDAILIKICGKPDWSKSSFTESDPTDDDGAMLRNFQEKYK